MECKISSLRAQTSYSNSVPCIIHILLYLENYNNCARGKTKILRCPPIRFRSGQDLCRHKLHYCRLYQISHLPVKYNLLVMYWHAFLIKLRMNTERAGDTPLSWCNFFKLWRTCSKKLLSLYQLHLIALLLPGPLKLFS